MAAAAADSQLCVVDESLRVYQDPTTRPSERGASWARDVDLPTSERLHGKVCATTPHRVYRVVLVFEHCASGESDGVPRLRQPARIVEREEEGTVLVRIHTETVNVSLGHVRRGGGPDREQQKCDGRGALVRDRL